MERVEGGESSEATGWVDGSQAGVESPSPSEPKFFVPKVLRHYSFKAVLNLQPA